MEIVIPTYNRPEVIKTHKIFDAVGFDNYTIIVHNKEQYELYRKNKTIRPERLKISGAPLGITNQRRWIIEQFIPKKRWFLTMDDNISHFTGVAPGSYESNRINVKHPRFDRETYGHKYDGRKFLELVENDIDVCESLGVRYGGFAAVDNYYFREKKYRYVGYVISKAAFIFNDGQEYDPQLEAMEDFGFTAHNLLRFGRVLINNFLFPVAGHYEPGGIGTYEQRLPRKIKDCEYLMVKFPGLFRYKVKKGCHPKAELQVRFTTLDQVERWHQQLLFGKYDARQR